MNTIAHRYQYAEPSHVADEQKPRLVLATSSADGSAHPHFFEGQLRNPRLVAELLTTLQLVVAARFFTPANTLARKLALADPVVTAGGGQLRFEGFSSCCSTYARVDLTPDAYDGELVGKGTTNVDFNAPMRAALARVRDADGLSLSVGRDELTLRSGGHEVVERKVDLPERWLRGMLEVQSYQASMTKRLEVDGKEALRFFRGLPKASTRRTPLWAVRGPAGLITTTQADPRGVRVADTQRLRVVEDLLPKARSLTVFADDAQQASAWVLELNGARITLALSAEVWRGFSGEGQALRALMRADDGDGATSAFARVRAHLQWQSSLDSKALAKSLDLDVGVVDDTLRVLGVSGLVGYDVFEQSYFHRVLPFDLSIVEDMHPRLAGAKALLGAVTLTRSSPLEADVRSGDVVHRVREVDGALRCTCPWFGRHQGHRGPCKHALAVEASRGAQG